MSLKTINFIQRKNKNIVFAEHHNQCDLIIKNFACARTVRTNEKYIFIKEVSFAYSCELLRNNKIPHTIKTEL